MIPVFYLRQRGEVVTSRWHVTKISSGSRQTAVLQKWPKKEKQLFRMYDFPAHDCTQEQKGSPRGPSIFLDKSGGRREVALQCSTMQMAFSVKKDCSDSEILLPW